MKMIESLENRKYLSANVTAYQNGNVLFVQSKGTNDDFIQVDYDDNEHPEWIVVSNNGGEIGKFDPATVKRIRVNAGNGNDVVLITEQHNWDSATLNGGNGSDWLVGSCGDDILNGGNGNDTLNGNGGDDTLTGGSGADQLQGGADCDVLSGGSGNDILNGGSGSDFISGGSGKDFASGGGGLDSVDSSVEYLNL